MRSSDRMVTLVGVLALAFVLVGPSLAGADPGAERAAADQQRISALAEQHSRAETKRASVNNAKAKLADRLETARQATAAVAAREAN